MKTLLFGAIATLLLCSLASAQPAPGKTEAQLLFDKCRAASAPTTIPSLLIRSQGSGVFRSSDEAKMDGEEEIDGQMCYKITARPAKETVSWWINKKTLLLRRIVGYTSEEQSAALLAEIDKVTAELDGKEERPEVLKLDMRFVSSVEDFEIDAINASVDEKLFATPAPK